MKIKENLNIYENVLNDHGHCVPSGQRKETWKIGVSIESLKRKYKALWYENPVNPTQIFSNSFILQMAAQRMQFEKTLRSCELWCRKQRST